MRSYDPTLPRMTPEQHRQFLASPIEQRDALAMNDSVAMRLREGAKQRAIRGGGPRYDGVVITPSQPGLTVLRFTVRDHTMWV